MAYVFYIAFLLLALTALSVWFVRASPSAIVSGVTRLGPLAIGLVGVVLTFAGRPSIGLAFLAAAIMWFMRIRAGRAPQGSGPRRSYVRSAALDMELDHDTGAMNGVVLAGRFEGRELKALGLAELLQLRVELSADAESLQLLEAYLDREHAGWRDSAEADIGAGLGSTPGTGAMTEQEAYQILGLEPGASAAEVRQAHRRLMQRMHPDVGGSPFLAARINAAKDFLLARHV